MGRKTQETRKRKYIRNQPFLSLLLSWRPNLGLFGPNTAPQLREKGVECPVMSSPSATLAYSTNIHQKYVNVKLIISIHRSL